MAAGHGGRHIEAILIAGPTASGKSALALRLAERLGGTVVNADSMQVYADLRVLTARPCVADEVRVPHRLYGTVDAADAYSVSRWLADAADAMRASWREDRIPIVVGGTGLNFKALTQGLSAIPPVPAPIRAEVRGWAAERAPAELHARLAEVDPEMAARLRSTDPQRIVRALEVFRATGQSLASFQAEREPPLVEIDHCVAVTLAPQRESSRARVDARFDGMIAAGALLEVARLLARRLPPGQPILRALGVPPLMMHLLGDITLADAIAQAKQDSRQYLKRQDTFARHQLSGFRSMADPETAEAYVMDQFV